MSNGIGEIACGDISDTAFVVFHLVQQESPKELY